MTLGTPGQQRQQRIMRALANPIYFGEVYVRPYDSNWTAPLPRFADQMLRFCVSERRGVVILPPEFLKTTLISQVLPLWLTARWTVQGRLLRGLLLSEEEGMAVNNLSVVAWHILHNDYLKADFADERGRPLLYPDPEEKTWKEDAIIVARLGTSKDPTWQAKGVDSKGIQGRRLDWLIGDDIVTPANAFSPAKRESALRTWDMQITTRLVKDGRAIVAGNFNDPHDLVTTLSNRTSYASFIRPAIHDRDDPSVARDIGDPSGVPLWEDNWPISRLAQEKAEKPNRFQRIFLLSATAEQGEKLLVHWARLIKPTDTPLGESKFYMAIDPAPGGETEDLDFFNVTLAASHGANLDIIESYNMRGTVARQVELVGQFHDRFMRVGRGVIAIGGAKVAMDRYFRGAVTISRPDLEHKMVAVSVPGAKEERIEALGPYAQTGYLRFWDHVWTQLTSDPDDRWQEMSMYEEWKSFPLGRHDDRLDGIDVAIRTAREFELVGDREYDLTVLEA